MSSLQKKIAKVTIICYGAALAVAALLLWLRQPRSTWRLLLYWTGACAVGFLLLGSPNYIMNLRYQGNLFGIRPEHRIATATVTSPSWNSVRSNLARICFDGIDTTGLPRAVELRLQRRLGRVGRSVFDTLGIDPNGPAGSCMGGTFGFYPETGAATAPASNRRNDSRAWMGPLGLLLLAPFTLVFAVWSWPRRRPPLTTVLSWSALAYLLVVALLLSWQPWLGRFMALGALTCLPLTAAVLRPGRRWAVVRIPVMALAAWVMVDCVVANDSKPLRGPDAFWRASRVDQLVRSDASFREFVRFLDAHVPPDASIGAGGVKWEYPLFGPRFSRQVDVVFLRQAGTQWQPSRRPDFLARPAGTGQPDPGSVEGYEVIFENRWHALLIRHALAGDWRADRERRFRETITEARVPELMEIDVSLSGRVAVYHPPHYSRWGIEGGWVIWLGSDEGQHLALQLYAMEPTAVSIAFTVSPGPACDGGRRRFRIFHTHDGRQVTHDVTAEGHGVVVAVPLTLSAGLNLVELYALDAATRTALANGDTRPLVAALQGIHVSAETDGM